MGDEPGPLANDDGIQKMLSNAGRTHTARFFYVK
jgi:hypothetical protein